MLKQTVSKWILLVLFFFCLNDSYKKNREDTNKKDSEGKTEKYSRAKRTHSVNCLSADFRSIYSTFYKVRLALDPIMMLGVGLNSFKDFCVLEVLHCGKSDKEGQYY